MATRQKALILSYHQPPELTPLVEALDKHGYKILMLVTGRGPNYALTNGSYEQMAAQIAGVFNEYDFPVLAVKSITQARAAILSLNADLAFCMGFPYRITEDLLSKGTKYVNMHPGPLPSLAGSMPFSWPILRPDLFPLENYRVTFHYMTPAIDEGRIIMAPKIQLPEGVDVHNVTATHIFQASIQVVGPALDEAVRLVKNGYEGFEAKAGPNEHIKDKDRRVSDEERTITRNMGVDQAERIWRARFGVQNPFFRTEQGLFQVVALRTVDPESSVAMKAKRTNGGAHRAGTRLTQVLQDGVLEIDLRKL